MECAEENPTHCSVCLSDLDKVHQGRCIPKTCIDLYTNCLTCDDNDESKCTSCMLTDDVINNDGICLPQYCNGSTSICRIEYRISNWFV